MKFHMNAAAAAVSSHCIPEVLLKSLKLHGRKQDFAFFVAAWKSNIHSLMKNQNHIIGNCFKKKLSQKIYCHLAWTRDEKNRLVKSSEDCKRKMMQQCNK